MVNIGPLSDEPWPEPEIEPVTIGQLRDATHDVSVGFDALAATMRHDGLMLDTSRLAYELGDKLRVFGQLHERYWNQVLDNLGIPGESRTH